MHFLSTTLPIFLCYTLFFTHAYEDGARAGQCTSMQPGVDEHGSAQTSASPYNITLSGTTYTPGDEVLISVTGQSYKGLMMQVRAEGGSTPQGTWTTAPPGTKFLTCSSADDTITHTNVDNKAVNLVYAWKDASGISENLQVVATVNEEKRTYWMNVKSAVFTCTGTCDSAPTTGGNFITSSSLMIIFGLIFATFAY